MTTHSLRNIARRIAEIQDQISLDKIRQASHSAAAFTDLQDRVLQQITHLVEAVERDLIARDLTAANLAIRSRRGYQWLKFLSDPYTLTTHLDALQRIILFLPGRRAKSSPAYTFSLYHQASLYKVSRNGNQIKMIAQESFLTAPDRIIKALAGVARDPASTVDRGILRDYTFTKEYRHVRKRLEYLGVPPGSFSAGRVHHLDQSFQRVNQEYFDGQLAHPNLAWSGRTTHRKFGHYQWDTDTVVVSSSLDQERVPELVVDYVIYHELLHKKLGARQAGKNRIAHTREFREAEQEFIGLEKARQILNRIAKKKARSSK